MDRLIAYMGDHTILTKLAHGSKIYLDTRDLSMTAHLVLDGYWENWITKLFLSIVKPGMTILDIGANCGYYSFLAAHLVGRHGTVHAFEPNPFHHNNFIKSKLINGYDQVHLHKVALVDVKGEITLYTPANLTGSASVYTTKFGSFLDNADQVTSINVPTVNLSEYLPRLKADVIKIDIEGAEPLIIDSILKIVNNSNEVKIIMEYNQQSWINNGYDCESILNRFIEHGFQIQIIQHNSTLLSVTSKELTEKKIEGTHVDLYLSNHKHKV